MRSVACKNDNTAYLIFEYRPQTHVFTSFLLLEHNSATDGNTLMVLNRIMEHVIADSRMQTDHCGVSRAWTTTLLVFIF